MNERELIRSDATIHYWTSSPDASPTLVLLHDATIDHGTWDTQVDALNSRASPDDDRLARRAQHARAQRLPPRHGQPHRPGPSRPGHRPSSAECWRWATR